jgi:thiamine pyrophosphokinase
MSGLLTGVIICNGEIRDYSHCRKYIDEARLIICADGGAAHARRMGIIPDILVGDFDSIFAGDLKHFMEMGVETVKFPAEKDMTDTELAADMAVKRGCRRVIILGGTGSRLDHTLSNIFLLKRLREAGVAGGCNEVALTGDRILLQREEGMKVSLLPLSDRVEGVSTRGLYYPLDNAVIRQGSSWGVSNEFTGETAEIVLERGLLLVIKSRE